MRFSSGVRLRLGTAARRRERQYAVTNHGGSDARARGRPAIQGSGDDALTGLNGFGGHCCVAELGDCCSVG